MSTNNSSPSLTEIKSKMDAYLSQAESKDELYERIANMAFVDKLFATYYDLGIVVLLLVNEADQMIDRIALSDTELAVGAVMASAKPFKEIRIPKNDSNNIIARVIADNKSIAVEDWQYLFTPALTASQARRNQVSAGIECSVVYPLDVPAGGAMIFSFYQPEKNLSHDHSAYLQLCTKLVSEHLRRFL